MTNNESDTTDEQPPDELLQPTQFAVDREDSGTLIVITGIGSQATGHTVAAVGKTVAELNPGYPGDDDVLFCAYRNALDDWFGDRWRTMSPTELAFQVGDQGVPVYSFPESRLEPEPREEEATDE